MRCSGFDIIQCLFLSVLFFAASCNAQVKTDLPKDSMIQKASIRDDQPRMVRTQGVLSGNVGCELQDREGNLWFSTSGEGVYRFDGKSFTNFTTNDGLSDNHVNNIIQDRSGNILIGTHAGISRYDGKTFSNYFNADSLNKLRIACLLEDRDGNLWFGTMNDGVYRYDGQKLTNFLNNNDHPFNLGNRYQLIMDMLQDRNGNIWFSSWNGGGVWRYDGITFTNYLPPKSYYLTNEDGRSAQNVKQEAFNQFIPKAAYPPSQDSITDDMISSISEDSDWNLWFATRRHGACRYDGKTFTSFREHEGFVSYGIRAILEDKKGIIWFGTDKNGVFSFDGRTFKNYTSADGLVNNSVRSILEDKDGNLWFGTRAFGLSRFDGITFVTFSE